MNELSEKMVQIADNTLKWVQLLEKFKQRTTGQIVSFNPYTAPNSISVLVNDGYVASDEEIYVCGKNLCKPAWESFTGTGDSKTGYFDNVNRFFDVKQYKPMAQYTISVEFATSNVELSQSGLALSIQVQYMDNTTDEFVVVNNNTRAITIPDTTGVITHTTQPDKTVSSICFSKKSRWVSGDITLSKVCVVYGTGAASYVDYIEPTVCKINQDGYAIGVPVYDAMTIWCKNDGSIANVGYFSADEAPLLYSFNEITKALKDLRNEVQNYDY